MDEFADIFMWAIILLGFVGGYLIVNFFADRMKATAPAVKDAPESLVQSQDGNPPEHRLERSMDAEPALSDEQRYAQILGISRPIVASEVRAAYEALLSKYDRDRGSQVAAEDGDSSSEKKAQEIQQAYEYFQRKYRIS
jgi:hypothetical protein